MPKEEVAQDKGLGCSSLEGKFLAEESENEQLVTNSQPNSADK